MIRMVGDVDGIGDRVAWHRRPQRLNALGKGEIRLVHRAIQNGARQKIAKVHVFTYTIPCAGASGAGAIGRTPPVSVGYDGNAAPSEDGDIAVVDNAVLR